MSINLSEIDMTMTYYYVAIFATILFVIKLVLFSIFGGDTEVSVDFNTEFDTDCSFDFISIQSLLAFLMGFGWCGYACLKEFGQPLLNAIIISLVTGFVFMFCSAYLMYLVKKLEKRVKKDKKTAINKVGKAYINMPSHGQGQIEIEVNGQLTVLDAVNDTEEEIKAFDMIRVVKIENDKMYVKKENNDSNT